MFKIARFRILLFVVACLLISSWCFAIPRRHIDRGKPHRSKEVLIRPKTGVDINAIARRYRLSPLTQIARTNIWRVSFGSTPYSEETLLNLLDRDPDVDLLELNFLLQNPEAQQQSVAFVDQQREPFVDQSSPSRYFRQRAYFQISVDSTRPSVTGRGITVAVVDTGITFNHPALQGKTVPGRDFIGSNPSDPTDAPGGRASGHGTFVSGLITLIAPDAKIMPLRALDTSGVGDVYKVADAIFYAADQGANVINLSIGLTYPSPIINQAIDYAYNANVLLIASAGNSNTVLPQYIASNEHVVGVAAVDGSDIKAGFSNYGPYIMVSAPGVNVYSTHLADRFATWSGTSFSAAFVSGQAALLLSVIPEMPSDLVAWLVEEFSDAIDDLNPSYRAQLGRGRINCSIAADLVPPSE